MRVMTKHVLAAAAALATAVVLTAACGGASPAPEPTVAAPSGGADAPAATATQASPAATATQAAPGTAANDLVERGREIYLTAGGVGCVSCHGPSGEGDGTANVGAPNIRAATKAQITGALQGGVPLMTFISLTPAEIDAVLAYIQTFSN